MKRHVKAKKKPRGRPFKPGQSGNPGGRPKGLEEFRLAARSHTVEALETLVRIMRGKKAQPGAAAKVRAIREILDRGWGRPVQELEVQASMAVVTTEAETLSDFDAARRIAFLLQGADIAGEARTGRSRA